MDTHGLSSCSGNPTRDKYNCSGSALQKHWGIGRNTTFTSAHIILVKVIYIEYIQDARAAQVEFSLWWYGGCWFHSRSLLTTCGSVEQGSKTHSSYRSCIVCVWMTTIQNCSSVFCKCEYGRTNARLYCVQKENYKSMTSMQFIYHYSPLKVCFWCKSWNKYFIFANYFWKRKNKTKHN